MDRVFAPFAASLQVVGMLAGGDTQNAPRTSIDNFGKPSSAAEVAFSTVDRAGVSTPLPDGSYRVLIRARRLFGDANSLEGYEAILSDVFVIQRSS